jgi:16S rRNA (adenine1518-N6/adenine1519-N6)-dimethyltransferase
MVRKDSRPGRAKDTLRDLQVRPTKERGQNFLIRPDVIESIVSFAAPAPDAHLVEIGPGMGALTEKLAHAKRLTLVEIEPKFCEYLSGRFPHADIVNTDARSLDFSTVGSNLFVFGNIPYVFSTEILFQLVRHRAVITQAVLMTQREFAERVAAQPGGRDYGSISVAVQVYADVELGPIVPGDAFHPPTAVESQLMKLTFLQSPRVEISDPEHFERVVRAAFAQRRKKVSNSLCSTGRWSKEVVLEGLAHAGISPNLRAERVTLEQYAELARALAGRAG